MDDGGIMGLLLVALTVGVDKQGEEAAKDGAAQAHGDHVEHVELSTSFLFYTTGSCHRYFWDEVRVESARPALCVVPRALAAHWEGEDALAGAELDSRRVTHGPFRPLGPALWAGLCVAQGLFGVQPQADVPSVGRGRVCAGARPHVVSTTTCR